MIDILCELVEYGIHGMMRQGVSPRRTLGVRKQSYYVIIVLPEENTYPKRVSRSELPDFHRLLFLVTIGRSLNNGTLLILQSSKHQSAIIHPTQNGLFISTQKISKKTAI